MSPGRRVPLLDLAAQRAGIRDELDAAVQGVISGGRFVRGEECARFEEEFAAYCQVRGCAGVGNGTDALELTLEALGIGRGDEVITCSHTFAASVEAILRVGARPVLVDIRPDTLLLDPDAVAAAVTPATRGVLAVHLYGQPCDITRLATLCKDRGLALVEDAAQAHGARWEGRRVGSLGTAACFSFYPGKNLGAFGDAGAVVSDDSALTDTIRALANHGRREKFVHEAVGRNSRLDELQAAVLRVKLRHLDGWNAARRDHAAAYRQALGAWMPAVDARAEHVYHQLVVQLADREAARSQLREAGIDTGVHYPVPVHLHPGFASLGLEPGALPVSEQAAKEVLSLPVFPELAATDRARVVQVIEALEPGRVGPTA